MHAHRSSRPRRWTVWGTALVVAGGLARAAAVPVDIQIVDSLSRSALPGRIHLKDSSGKAIRAPNLPFFHDHFVCPGKVNLELPPGEYRYEVERGPDYDRAAGRLEVEVSKPLKLAWELRRLVDLSQEGWWSGDLHIHRPVADIELLLNAEDLHIGPVITWWNEQNLWQDRAVPSDPLRRIGPDRYSDVLGGEDEREGGALLYFHLPTPLHLRGASREYPSPMKFLAEARRHDGAWVDIEKPFWWDVPVWVASGQVDSIGLANNHMCRDRMYENEAWGRPRDAQRLPPPRGNGFWTQEIYYHLLNCGLRLPPSAGSASGVLPNPVGYNRVYVHTGPTLDYQAWWKGLRAGRSFVSNGPLLRCRANGQLPGHFFSAPDSGSVPVRIDALLTSRDPVLAFEIIRDGCLERSVSLEEWRKNNGSLGELEFTQSGWFLVRVIAEDPRTFRFASTAPFYVEAGPSQRRVSRTSARFFVEWVRERLARVKVADAGQLEEVLSHHRRAQAFWAAKLAEANAE